MSYVYLFLDNNRVVNWFIHDSILSNQRKIGEHLSRSGNEFFIRPEHTIITVLIQDPELETTLKSIDQGRGPLFLPFNDLIQDLIGIGIRAATRNKGVKRLRRR